MRWLVVVVALCAAFHLSVAANPRGADVEDNDFAEFEDFEDEEEVHTVDQAGEDRAEEPRVIMSPQAEGQEAEVEDEETTVEDEDDEFGHLQDEEEFEGFEKERMGQKGKAGEKVQEPLKITNIPLHLRTNWDSFYMEMLMLAGLGVYFLNFLAGKSKNNRLAQAWLNAHKDILEANFSVVGDDGQSTEVQKGVLMRESENIYSLWCSGRTCCEGMLVTLKLLKRQDLVSTITRMLKPASDQIIVKVTMDDLDMDNFVFCLAHKRVVSKLQKEMLDLSLFCPDKRSADKFSLPPQFQMLSEITEASQTILDKQVCACISKLEHMVEYIHFSDKYSGPKQQEESSTSKQPETSKVLIFCFNVPGRGKSMPNDMESMKPLMQMVFHCVEKVRRLKLSKESKVKAERNRVKVEETFLKASHAQRQEAAQQRREDKRRAEKERIMNEEDPDKQRKWEERENRRDMKKRQAKVKMMKIKGM